MNLCIVHQTFHELMQFVSYRNAVLHFLLFPFFANPENPVNRGPSFLFHLCPMGCPSKQSLIYDIQNRKARKSKIIFE
jgi:hypothetical protein